MASNPVLSDFEKDATKIVDFMHAEFTKLQTGRANAALVEHVQVDSYGQKMDLRSIASVSVQDASTIIIQAWDKNALGDIEKALQQVDLGCAPVNDGTVIRISLPPMTEERRSQLKKIVAQLEEEAKIKVRQHRHDAQAKLKELEDEDDRERGLKELQKAVDTVNEELENSAKKKQEEVMSV